MKRLVENGGVCAECKRRVGEFYEDLTERVRDEKLEKLELELEL